MEDLGQLNFHLISPKISMSSQGGRAAPFEDPQAPGFSVTHSSGEEEVEFSLKQALRPVQIACESDTATHTTQGNGMF